MHFKFTVNLQSSKSMDSTPTVNFIVAWKFPEQ